MGPFVNIFFKDCFLENIRVGKAFVPYLGASARTLVKSRWGEAACHDTSLYHLDACVSLDG